MDFLSLFVELLFDFHEDPWPFRSLHLLKTDGLEDLSEFVAEIPQIFSDLSLLVKRDHQVLMVDNRANEIDAIALKKESFNFFPGAEECKLLGQQCKADIRVKMFALLENPYSQHLFDKLLIFCKLRVLNKSWSEGSAPFFWNFERRLFCLNQIKQSLDFWCSLNNMGTFWSNEADQRWSGWSSLDLQHLSNFENLLWDDLGQVKLILDVFG